jgi:hypothetical protein
MASIKMAKAKASTIDNAIKLAQLTDSVCNCRSYEYPEFPPESDDQLPENFDVDSAADLRKFYDRVSKLSTGLMLVAFGYGVLVDNCCDPTKDTLEHKPGAVTLDDEDRKLLKEFKDADAAYVVACRKVNEAGVDDADIDSLFQAMNKASDLRSEKAIEFADRAAISITSE